MTSAIVSLIILALIAFWCIRTVNDFKKKEIRVQEGLSGIEVALTKRYDKLVSMKASCSQRSSSCVMA